jgi:hypothetical protein
MDIATELLDAHPLAVIPRSRQHRVDLAACASSLDRRRHCPIIKLQPG